MKVLLVDSSYPINNRNLKILNSLKNRLGAEIEISVCTWNRDDRPVLKDDVFSFYIFGRKADYGQPVAKLKGIIPYFKFLKSVNNEIKPDIIIASHWDVLALVSLIKRKEQKVIYENLDMPTASNPVFRSILRSIEMASLKKVSAIIFASRFFEECYKKVEKKKIVIENLPFKNVVMRTNTHTYESDKLKVSFIGTLRYFDVMKNLIDGVKELPVEILFWGDGPDLNLFKDYSADNPDVKFFGKYDYKTIADIYALSDIVWAVYPSLDYNVKYAISNKFYECLLFNKPGVFAKNTMLGDLVETDQIGYTVDPYDTLGIRKLFEGIILDKSGYEKIRINLDGSDEKKNWEDDENILIDLISKL
jgi:hypothetical protein